MLTPGQAHDLACAQPLIDSADPEALIGDKAYDADPLIDTLNQRQITPVIRTWCQFAPAAPGTCVEQLELFVTPEPFPRSMMGDERIGLEG
jgi:Transposase DDE domain